MRHPVTVRLLAILSALNDHRRGAPPRPCPFPYGDDWQTWTDAYAGMWAELGRP